MQSYELWKDAATEGKGQVYLATLSLLCTYYQLTFPCHIERVQSNDELYGCNPDYMNNLNLFIDSLVTQILKLLIKDINAKDDMVHRRQQNALIIEFINTIIASFEL